MLRYLLLFLILAVAARAQVPVGASKKEVIDTLGWPKSTSGTEAREILNYPEFTIYLVDGKVVNLQQKPVDQSRRPKPAGTKPRAVQPQATPPPMAIPVAPAVVPAKQSQPATQQAPYSRSGITQPSPLVDPFASLKRTMIGMVAVFLLLGVGGIVLRYLLRRQARDRNEDDRLAQMPPLLTRTRPDPLKDGWTLELLKLLEWHRFEQVVAEYHRLSGNRAELTTFGADGGIDIEVYRPAEPTPFLLIQCKAWANEPVGVALVRELFGVAAARRIPGTAFHTTSIYTPDARTFAASVNMELIDGPGFVERIKRLPLSSQIILHEFATAGDYTTPTCSRCGIKMVRRLNKRRRTSFWGCTNYPKCDNQMFGSA